jgi:hypothetical protein
VFLEEVGMRTYRGNTREYLDREGCMEERYVLARCAYVCGVCGVCAV